MAGSEFKRDETFTGPAIGILGATQLNGGAVATAIVMTVLGILLRSGYEYYRKYQWTCWAQARFLDPIPPCSLRLGPQRLTFVICRV